MQLTKIQEAWLQDLESGKYKQGREFLKNSSDGYCCLGVFAEKHSTDSYLKDDRWVFEGDNQGLSTALWVNLGLLSSLGKLEEPFLDEHGNEFFDLAQMNDSEWTFKEIAAYIRANPENVFTNS